MDPATHYTLRRNIASIMKILFKKQPANLPEQNTSMNLRKLRTTNWNPEYSLCDVRVILIENQVAFNADGEVTTHINYLIAVIGCVISKNQNKFFKCQF